MVVTNIKIDCDAWVNKLSSGTNYGGSDTMSVFWDAAYANKWGWVWIPGGLTAKVPGTITACNLVVWAYNVSGTLRYLIVRKPNFASTEYVATYTNLHGDSFVGTGANSDVALSNGAANVKKVTIPIDITWISVFNTNGFFIDTNDYTSATDNIIYTRHTSTPPYFQVTYTPRDMPLFGAV